jgi:glycosyltransferase involved in cell wall biosynthesis
MKIADRPGVLFLSFDGLTDPLGQSQVLPYVIGLSKEGFDFTIVSFEKSGPYRKNQKRIQQLCDENKVRWKPLKYHGNPPVIGTLLNLFNLWRLAGALHKDTPFSLVHGRSYFPSIVALWLKRKFGVKFLFDMRGFWADERVEGGLWNLKNPVYNLIYKYFKRKEREFLSHADQIVSLTENAKDEILSWNISSAPITVIPTCVDFDKFDPQKITEKQKTERKKELGLTDTDFILLYLGSWGTWYMTTEMFNFFSELKKQRPRARFLIVSPNNIDLSGYQHGRDVVICSVPSTEVPLHIALSDAAVFFIYPSFSKKASAATKMGEILALNKPMVTNTGWGDISRYKNEGYFLTVSNPSEYAGVITKLLDSFQSPVHSREWAESSLSLQRGVALFKSVYIA